MSVTFLAEWTVYDSTGELRYDHSEDWWENFWFENGPDIGKECGKWGASMRRDVDKLFVDFEDEKDATLFLLRWA